MATVYHDKSADLSLIRSKKVAIIGYGSQGHAHALNLSDNGVDVRVGLHAASKSREKVRRAGLTCGTVAEVSAWADVVMILTPDTSQPAIYRKEVAPNLKPGSMLMFAHGFNIRYGTIECPAEIDVAPQSVTVEITGTEDKIDGLLEVLQPYGILEMVRTGVVAMKRGAKSSSVAASTQTFEMMDEPGISCSV